MEFENKIAYNENKMDSNINLVEVFEKFKISWKWFILSLFLSLLLAFVYIRYAKNQFEVSSIIFIDDKNSGSMATELTAFEDLGLVNGPKKSIINEIGVLGSVSLMERVVNKLGINVTYYLKGKIVNNEIYGKDVPFKVNFMVKDSILNDLNTEFTITAHSDKSYLLTTGNGEISKKFAYKRNIKLNFGEINITPITIEDLNIGESIEVKITPLKKIAKNYKNRLLIEPQSKESSLLVLSLTDEVEEKAEDILNNLVLQYIDDGIAYKTMISKNTDKFVNDRILDISLDLTNIDKGVEDFKKKNNLTNMEFEVGLDLQSNSDIQKKIIDLNSQLKLIDYIISYLEKNKESLIPANLGLKDTETNAATDSYNKLIMERNRIIQSSSKLNPMVINLEAQLVTFRQSVVQSLLNLRSSLIFYLDEAKNQKYKINTKRDVAPQQEREFQDIKRKQQIIESLYLYLLQKREENALSLGIPVPNAKIIDRAEGNSMPIFPNPKLIYSIAALLGLIIPTIILSVRRLLDNKVHIIEDIETVVRAPIIGNIPRTNTKKKVIITEHGNSNTAEAFRLLRTNVNFMLVSAKETAKIIYVTSTIASEGKTFITINLAMSMALLNKKTLLIGADIRKPKIDSYLGLKHERGLTHYLIDKNLNVSDIIMNYNKDSNNIDIINAGEIPPNPSELLLNGRFKDVLAYGKEHYDYVFIDTPPVNSVTDTLLLGAYADLFIYVVRAEYLDKRLLKIPKIMYKNKRLPNMTMLINATKDEYEGYGYGYGYVERKKSWWKRIFVTG